MKFPGTIGILTLVAITAIGCAVTPKDYTLFHQANPQSLLIVPAINNSAEVEADTYFLATVGLPLAERGYYVFPVNLTRELLIEVGLDDPGLVHQADPMRLGKLFGADAILYIQIDHWKAQYIVIDTTVQVGFSYVIKETASGAEIWSHKETMKYSSGSGNNQGLLGAIVAAAVTKAAPNYIPLAKKANKKAFGKKNQGIPPGPYLKKTQQ